MKRLAGTITLIFVSLLALSQQPKSSIKEGDIIPAINKLSHDGQQINLSKIESKLIIVDFWASWCGPCIKSYKTTLKPLYERYDRSQVEVIGISNDKKHAAWTAAIEKWKMPWPNVWDDDQSLVRAFDVPALPTYFVIDNTGKVLATNVFSSELDRTVERLLKD